MEHLNNNEIMDFIKIDKYNADTAELVRRINSHILCCPECAAKVKRAVRAYELMNAVSAENFSMKDVCYSVYDIPAEAVAFEAASAFEDNEEFRY